MNSRRLPWLLLVLATTAALAAFGDADAPVTASGAAEALPAIRALKPRGEISGQGGDPFVTTPAATRREPAAGVINAISAVPPAPTFQAPLPWRVIGKQLADDDGWTVFLARGEETLIVRAGDMLDDTYRVAAITPPTLTLLHLNRKTRRTLDIGEAKE